MLSDSEFAEIHAGLEKGVGGPLLVKWARQLLEDGAERRRGRPTRPDAAPRGRWESVVTGVAGKREPQELTQRLRVPGGWIYRSIIRGLGGGTDYAVSMCFVPEPPRQA